MPVRTGARAPLLERIRQVAKGRLQQAVTGPHEEMQELFSLVLHADIVRAWIRERRKFRGICYISRILRLRRERGGWLETDPCGIGVERVLSQEINGHWGGFCDTVAGC